MVVSYHFGPHIVRGDRFAFLYSVPGLWFQGVDLFFVLSGFLISDILVRARESPRYFSTFYARRAFRIFPLYYAVFCAYMLTVAILGPRTVGLGRLFENPLPIWPYSVYLQNFTMAATNSFGPIWMAGSWSLAVEEQFYFTLPAIIRKVQDGALLRISLIGIVCAPLLRALIQKFKFAPGLSNYVLLPTRLDALAVGVLVMLILRHRAGTVKRHGEKIALACAALLAAWTVYPYVPNPEAIRLAFVNTTMNSLVFGSILLCLLTLPGSLPARLLSTRPMRNLGNLAYSTYLLHPILLCVAFRTLKNQDPALINNSDVVPVIAAFLATISLSWVSWTLFESKLLTIGHRFRY